MTANLPIVDVRAKWDAFAGSYSADTASIQGFPETHGTWRRDFHRNLVASAHTLGLHHVELRVSYPNGTRRLVPVH